MTRKIESYTRPYSNVISRMFGDKPSYETVIYDNRNNRVSAIGETKEESRDKAQERWMERELERKCNE